MVMRRSRGFWCMNTWQEGAWRINCSEDYMEYLCLMKNLKVSGLFFFFYCSVFCSCVYVAALSSSAVAGCFVLFLSWWSAALQLNCEQRRGYGDLCLLLLFLWFGLMT
ncbi:unnamed protein product [Trifolium pratense]|uniref:Uncharacterized protein n=1 Tax=Trifolium pratense TaxID=57577 RepID=A0ACB0JJC0_TRIPR|nr:unnamed protein product [Trifolium pratense]